MKVVIQKNSDIQVLCKIYKYPKNLKSIIKANPDLTTLTSNTE